MNCTKERRGRGEVEISNDRYRANLARHLFELWALEVIGRLPPPDSISVGTKEDVKRGTSNVMHHSKVEVSLQELLSLLINVYTRTRSRNLNLVL